MNSAKWTWFAITYQCGLAYVSSLIVYQVGCAFTGNIHPVGFGFALVAFIAILHQLFKPYRESTKLTVNVK